MSGVTMYSTPWCGYCTRLKGQLDREGVHIDVVDIDRDPAAAELVRTINNGNRTVPTVVYPDGSAHTNPPLKAVLGKLDELRASA
jgi:mycoredoxin